MDSLLRFSTKVTHQSKTCASSDKNSGLSTGVILGGWVAGINLSIFTAEVYPSFCPVSLPTEIRSQFCLHTLKGIFTVEFCEAKLVSRGSKKRGGREAAHGTRFRITKSNNENSLQSIQAKWSRKIGGEGWKEWRDRWGEGGSITCVMHSSLGWIWLTAGYRVRSQVT